jgi:hypothetical protein
MLKMISRRFAFVSCSILALVALGRPMPAATARVAHIELPADLSGEKTAGITQLADGSSAWTGQGALTVDLSALGIDPTEYDHLKLQVKAEDGAFAVANMANHPADGAACSWYFLDGMRKAFEWRTVWLDLDKPEELTTGGARMRAGGDLAGGESVLRIRGSGVMIRHIRLVKEAVHLDWDQRRAPCTWGEGQDLVYRYPLELSNETEEKLTAKVSLDPLEVQHATATLARESVTLEAGEKTTVEARIRLPAEVAGQKEPLYCERFRALARAEGVDDSTVTLLTSSDVIHLSATVPIPEERLAFPLLGRRRTLPRALHRFPGESEEVRRVLEKTEPADLRRAVANGGLELAAHWLRWLNWLREYNGLEPWEKSANQPHARQYLRGVSTAAFLHDFTGKRTYLQEARKLLLVGAELWPRVQAEYDRMDFKLVSQGLFADNTLHLGFRVGGTTRPPYSYGGTARNDGFGVRHGPLNAFDLVAAELPSEVRNRIIADWILPMGVKTRNHYIGPGNQQLHHNYVTMYAGLAARNWPLVSFAYSSQHGLLANMERGFGPNGMARDAEHHNYALNPLLWTTELLYHQGVDLYKERLYTILHSKTAAELGEGYQYESMSNFLDRHRFAGKAFLAESKRQRNKEGTHLPGGLTTLRWEGLEVLMNWQTQMYRGCPARCALTVRGGGLRMGGIVESQSDRSAFGNSVLIVDELHRQPPANPTSVDVRGPVQHIQARSKPGAAPWTTTRTFALLGEHVLVVDRLTSQQPRTVDWLLRDAPAPPDVDLQKREESFTEKPGSQGRGIYYGAELEEHHYARAESSWSTTDGRLTMLGTEPGGVYYFRWKKSPTLMVRRRKVRRTDFVAFISRAGAKMVRLPASLPNGGKADAVAVKVILENGTTVRAIVNYEEKGTTVSADGLTTSERFATDYKPGQPR